MEEPTENELMLEVKAGDLDKMSLLFKRRYKALNYFLFQMTGNKEASEDMVQEVFYRMLKYRHSFKGDGNFHIWMFHIARNVLKDYFNKSRRNGIKYSLDQIQEEPASEVLSDEVVKKKQEVLQLHQALNQLPGDEKEVLILSKYHDLKYREIADIMGTTEGAVKVRVHRAFNRLKNIYQKTDFYEL